MRKRERTEQEKVRKMVLPKENFPDLYGLMRQLAQILIPKIKKMDSIYMEVFGKTMLDIFIKLVETYFRMANGRIPRNVAREEMLGRIDEYFNLGRRLAADNKGEIERWFTIAKSRKK